MRKLLGTVWFRAVVPCLSPAWRDRVLEVLVEHVPIPNHRVKIDGRGVLLSELSHAQFDSVRRTYLPDVARADVELLMTDVIMPGSSGPDLYRTLARRKPALKVLFTSGYTADDRPAQPPCTGHGVSSEAVYSGCVVSESTESPRRVRPNAR